MTRVAVLDIARLVAGTAILAYASVLDVRTRRVPNRTWLVGGALAALLLLLDVVALHHVDPVYLILIPALMLVFYGLWYAHLIAGGADAKALMTLALLAPYPIELAAGARTLPLWPSPLPVTVVTFANSLLLFVAVPLVFFVYNAVRGDVRFPSMLLGYTMSLDRAEGRFVWVSERVDDSGRIHQVLLSSKQSPEEQAENIARLRAAGRTRAWVTPKIPFMVPLLGGYVAAFLLGDVFTKVLSETLLRGRA
jgi:archaeal preflagellin peptidase FlaK